MPTVISFESAARSRKADRIVAVLRRAAQSGLDLGDIAKWPEHTWRNAGVNVPSIETRQLVVLRMGAR